MADVLRIKRRSSGGSGPPASLAYAELAYNEVNDILYYGKGNNAGQALSIIPIAGPGFSGGGSSVTCSDTPPASPVDNSLWFESDTGGFFLRFNDGTSSQWVSVGGPSITLPIAETDVTNLVSDLASKLPLAGGTLSGELLIAPTATNSVFRLRKPTSGLANYIIGETGSLARWHIIPGDTSAESTGNVGSDFVINSYNDSGVFLATPFRITRSNGGVTLNNTTVSATGSNWATLTLQKPASGTGSTIYGYLGSSVRWEMSLGNQTAESGSNAGSNFSLARFADNGTYLDTTLSINRANGNVTFSGAILPGAVYLPNMGSLYIKGTAGVDQQVVTLWSDNAVYLGVYNPGFTTVIRGDFTKLTATANAGLEIWPAGTVGLSYNCALKVHCQGGGIQYGIGVRQLADNTNAMIYVSAANAVVGGIYTTSAATTFQTSSDARLKDDLQDFDSGSIIDSTEVYNFAWRATGERAHGVVAQQAVEVYPEAVVHCEEIDYWGIDYSKYVPVLLQELKSLRERVKILESKLV